MSRPAIDGENLLRGAILAAALMMSHQVAGKALRDALFLPQFGPHALPRMVAAAALVAVLLAVASGFALRVASPAALLPVSLVFSGLLHTGEWGLASRRPGAAALLVYLHIASLGPVLLSGLWSLLNERFDPYAAKRSFSRIAAAGTVGGLAGGLVAERLAALVSGTSVLLYLAVVHLTSAWALRRIAAPAAVVARAPGPRRIVPVEVFSGTPYLLGLAGLVIAGACSATLVDFVFKAQATAAFPDTESLVRFFALFLTGVSLLSVVVQSFVTRRVLDRAGLARTAAALPLAIASGGLGVLALPAFGAVAGLRALEALLRGTLFRSAYELFYTPLPPERKRLAKSMIDIGADRLGDAIGAGFVQLLLALRAPPGYRAILAAGAGVATVGLLLATRLSRGYIRALEVNLLRGAVDLPPSEVLDSTTRSVVMRTAWTSPSAPSAPRPAPSANPPADLLADLRSGHAARVRAATVECGPLDRAVVSQLILLLAWDEVAASARSALQRALPAITGQLIDSLLDPSQDFAIRRRVPRILALCDSPRAVEGLLLGLADARFEVRFQCGRALDAILRRNPAFALDRAVIFAAVNREVSVGKPVWDGYRLLDRRDTGEEWLFLDEVLRQRANHGLEHVFSLLGLVLPRELLRIAFRALHTDDPALRGTALEYLDNALPQETRARLWSLVEPRPSSGERRHSAEEVIARLMQSNESVLLRLRELESRRPKAR